jgi:hypothetical protein
MARKNSTSGAGLVPVVLVVAAAIAGGILSQRDGRRPFASVPPRPVPSVPVVPPQYKVRVHASGLGSPPRIDIPDAACWFAFRIGDPQHETLRASVVMGDITFSASDGGGVRWPLDVAGQGETLYVTLPKGYGPAPEGVLVRAHRPGMPESAYGQWPLPDLPAEPRLIEAPASDEAEPWPGARIKALGIAPVAWQLQYLGDAGPIEFRVARTTYREFPDAGWQTLGPNLSTSYVHKHPGKVDAVEVLVRRLEQPDEIKTLRLKVVLVANAPPPPRLSDVIFDPVDY